MFHTFPAFHVPIFLSVHIPLGDTFKPAYLSDTCNIAGSFILTTFTHPHTHRHRRQPRFHGSFVLTRTFSVSSVRFSAHSRHRHFLDPRRIICTQHLCRAFVNHVSTLLRQTSADFRELSDILRIVPLMPVAVLGQAFPGVTPSFHLLEYPFYETVFQKTPFNFYRFSFTPDLFSQERVTPLANSSMRKCTGMGRLPPCTRSAE